jgi:hypothetical protein
MSTESPPCSQSTFGLKASVLIVSCLLICLNQSAQGECRLLAAWFERQGFAAAQNGGPGGTSEDNTGTAGVPGRGDYLASARSTSGELVTARSWIRYSSHEIEKGLTINLESESGISGDFVPTAHGVAYLWIDFEVVGNEAETIFLDSIRKTPYYDQIGGHTDAGFQMYRLPEDGGYTPDGGTWRHEENGADGLRLHLDAGHEEGGSRFRIQFYAITSIHPSHVELGFESFLGATFSCEMTFLNYSIEPGAFQRMPILPPNPPSQTAAFRDVPSRRYFDPPLASGFRFSAVNGTLFDSIVALPTGFQSGFEIWVDGGKVGSAGAGEGFSFTGTLGAPTAEFEVRNIRPFVDGSSPTAFPIMLAFTEATGSFDMTSIPAPWVTIKPAGVGAVEIDWFGVLQSSTSLSEGSWQTFDPQPTPPLFFEIPEGETRRFFRAMAP